MAMNKARSYLVQNLDSLQSPYAMAITAYALSLNAAQSSEAREAHRKRDGFTYSLMAMAECDMSYMNRDSEVTERGKCRAVQADYRTAGSCFMVCSYLWRSSTGELCFLTRSERCFWNARGTVPGLDSKADAISIEATGYGLLHAVTMGDKTKSQLIAAWLTEQRKYGGGFRSTQDTVVALEGLFTFSTQNNDVTDLDLRVEVCLNDERTQVLHLTKKNALTQEAVQVKDVGKVLLDVSGRGRGTLTVSALYAYTVLITFQTPSSCTALYFQIVQTYRSLRKDESYCNHFNLSVQVDGELRLSGILGKGMESGDIPFPAWNAGVLHIVHHVGSVAPVWVYVNVGGVNINESVCDGAASMIRTVNLSTSAEPLEQDGEQLDDYYNYDAAEEERREEPLSRADWFDLRSRRKRQAPELPKKESTLVYTVCLGLTGGNSTGMVVVDISLLSGLTPNIQDLEDNVKGTEKYIDHYDVHHNKVFLYFCKLTESNHCLRFRADQIVPVGLVQPAAAVIYDYYSPDRRCSIFYTVPESSPMLSKLCDADVCSCAESEYGVHWHDLGQLEHPHTVPADGAVGVEVEGHQVFWTCDHKPFVSVLTTVPPHTDSLGVSTKTKAGLSCVVQPSADGVALTGGLMEDTTARWRSVTVVLGQSGGCPRMKVTFSKNMEETTRRRYACFSPVVDYIYTVRILNSSSDGVFTTYSTTITNVLQTGKDTAIQKGAYREMVQRAACDEVNLANEAEYLIMGINDSISVLKDRFKYLLNNKLWIEEVPPERKCKASRNRAACQLLKNFMEQFLIRRCQD
ncbi:hypothetical protein NFI96_030760 [Prochilodus magdalenae]|nr:hypothetical protein NFI96_030760 [Prochilodus magdalenae]